jgi:hypothetical protein
MAVRMECPTAVTALLCPRAHLKIPSLAGTMPAARAALSALYATQARGEVRNRFDPSPSGRRPAVKRPRRSTTTRESSWAPGRRAVLGDRPVNGPCCSQGYRASRFNARLARPTLPVRLFTATSGTPPCWLCMHVSRRVRMQFARSVGSRREPYQEDVDGAVPCRMESSDTPLADVLLAAPPKPTSQPSFVTRRAHPRGWRTR